MRWFLVSVLALALLLLAGCWAVSIFPLYTDKDLIWDKQLVGSWSTSDGSNSIWSFAPSDTNSYVLTVREENERDAQFEAHLLRLKDHLFLDLLPAQGDFASDFYTGHLLPAHSFWRVDLKDDTLRLGMLSMDWLEEAIDKGTVSIPHLERNDGYVLTAPTQELQAFVLSHLEEAFKWEDPLVRIP
ncbi:hypothetical protein KKH27_09905 [bacterium]|nr:hypothetical protein [bacterium]MBU1984482.1 hypothetical protein [bacterium]